MSKRLTLQLVQEQESQAPEQLQVEQVLEIQSVKSEQSLVAVIVSRNRDQGMSGVERQPKSVGGAYQGDILMAGFAKTRRLILE